MGLGSSKQGEVPIDVKPVSDLADLRASLRIRLAVFVSEQNVPLDEEIDADDARAVLYLASIGDRAVGTSRLVARDSGRWIIGRLAVLRPYRKQGVGTALMERMLSDAGDFRTIALNAQAAAVSFYERWGFEIVGEEFMDAGILHRPMEREPDIKYGGRG